MTYILAGVLLLASIGLSLLILAALDRSSLPKEQRSNCSAYLLLVLAFTVLSGFIAGLEMNSGKGIDSLAENNIYVIADGSNSHYYLLRRGSDSDAKVYILKNPIPDTIAIGDKFFTKNGKYYKYLPSKVVQIKK